MEQKLMKIFQKFIQYWDRNHTAIESIEKKSILTKLSLWPFSRGGPSDNRALWLNILIYWFSD